MAQKAVVILSERQRVEGSSHFVNVCSTVSAKILRLPSENLRFSTVAQDDTCFRFLSLMRFIGLAVLR